MYLWSYSSIGSTVCPQEQVETAGIISVEFHESGSSLDLPLCPFGAPLFFLVSFLMSPLLEFF